MCMNAVCTHSVFAGISRWQGGTHVPSCSSKPTHERPYMHTGTMSSKLHSKGIYKHGHMFLWTYAMHSELLFGYVFVRSPQQHRRTLATVCPARAPPTPTPPLTSTTMASPPPPPPLPSTTSTSTLPLTPPAPPPPPQPAPAPAPSTTTTTTTRRRRRPCLGSLMWARQAGLLGTG